MSSPSSHAKTGLQRGLSLGPAAALVAGAIIGSGVFLVAAEVSKAVPTPAWALTIWVVAAILSLMGGLIVAELGAAFPGEGGPYLYFREAFSPLVGFLNGWTVALVVEPGSIAATAIGFAYFSTYFVPLSPWGIKLVATAVVVFFTAINLVGLRAGAGVMTGLTVLKVLALVVIGVAGLVLPARVDTATFLDFHGLELTGFGVALIAAFWPFDGWLNISFIAGEVDRPQRNIPLALLGGIGAAAVLNFFANFAYYRFLPVSVIAHSVFPAGDAARVVGGDWAVRFINVAVMLSTLGCANALTLAGARVFYAMAADGRMPKWLAYVHPENHVPSNALIAQLVVTELLILSGSYVQLVIYVIAAEFIFYALMACALLRLRRTRPELERPYRVPLYPVLPVLYLIFSLCFLGNAFLSRPKESLAGVALIVLGVPFYYWLGRRKESEGVAGLGSAR